MLSRGEEEGLSALSFFQLRSLSACLRAKKAQLLSQTASLLLVFYDATMEVLLR